MKPAHETIDHAVTAETQLETPVAPPLHETQEIALNAHDTVANLVPDEVQRREQKSYRDAGGGWRVWR